MHVLRLDPDELSATYGIGCQGVFPWPGVTDTPFSITWCVVGAGGTARAHKHQEHEAFAITRGRGRMRVDDEIREVGPGDVVFMSPWSTHELINLSDSEELVFLDLCWEVMEEAVERNREQLARAIPATDRKVLVTATPPTPNGDLHVGHLSGPYLAADVHTRYLRMRGADALYLSGADDHQSYVETKARIEGKTSRALSREYAERVERTLESGRIEMDLFARPETSPHHRDLTREMFRVLWERGAVISRAAPTPWCPACERYLYEAHAVGSCPHCGADSNGNACEACARPNDTPELENLRCKHCDGAPEVRLLERFYFPLAPYADRLKTWWDSITMSPHLRAMCDHMLAEGLPEIAISQETDWGIEVPVEGFEAQRIYVWFEMAPGYLAATREALEARGVGDDGWEAVWKSPEWDVVQFFGFDNGYFHAVLFPAIWMAYDEKIRLPKAFVVNEFYLYEGSKFSTSRDHAMWGRELFSRVSADEGRFYLALDGPETEQRNFVFSELEQTVGRDFHGEWHGWLRDLDERLARDFDGVVPWTGGWTDDQQRLFERGLRLVDEAAAAYEAADFSPSRVVQLLTGWVRAARRFGRSQQHWRGLTERYEEYRTALAVEVWAAKVLAVLSAPVLPDFAIGLWRALGEEGNLAHGSWEAAGELLHGGRRVELSHLSRQPVAA